MTTAFTKSHRNNFLLLAQVEIENLWKLKNLLTHAFYLHSRPLGPTIYRAAIQTQSKWKIWIYSI